MVPARQRPISVNAGDRNLLDSQKKRFDGATGQESDWGSFLATVALLGLAAAGVYYLAKTTKRSPQAIDVECDGCKGIFQMALPQGTNRAIYTTCPRCNAELVVYLKTQR